MGRKEFDIQVQHVHRDLRTTNDPTAHAFLAIGEAIMTAAEQMSECLDELRKLNRTMDNVSQTLRDRRG